MIVNGSPFGGVVIAGTRNLVPLSLEGAAVRINCGGGEVAPFGADQYFDASPITSYPGEVSVAGVIDPAPQMVYQTVRYGDNFAYEIPNLSAGATYKIRLHFAEQFYQFDERRQIVKINNVTVLSDYSIAMAAGGRDKAIVFETLQVASAGGLMRIEFSAHPGTIDPFPIISGIEILGAG